MFQRYLITSAYYPPFSISRRAVPHLRRQSGGRTPWKKDTTAEPSVFIEENFAKHTVFVLDVMRRLFKFSAIGLLTLGITAATVYEGVHWWVENVELASETDEEVRKWEWDLEVDKWNGDYGRGGTDSALGYKGRHTVRAAWMAYNWGVGYSTAVIGSEHTARGEGLVGPGGLNLIDARLQRAEDFLRTVISIAEGKLLEGKIHSKTLPELIARHATVLERLGTQFLPDSKSQYERVWAGLSGKGPNAARIAMKLGDLNSRMGQTDDALSWWSRAIELARGETLEVKNLSSVVPNTTPSTPMAQRILSTVLVSLSASYAMSGQLGLARSIEETSLSMLRSIRVPESLASASPPEALHALHLLQRSSLLSIHLAEVLHAQHQPVSTSIQWLISAAESSERVAHALTGLPMSYPGGFTAKNPTPDPVSNPLLSVYASSRSMKRAATGLLRDARRTAAEAWNLMGVLNEAQGSNPMIALQCYERAIDWAGRPPDKSSMGHAAEGILESDWNIFLANYTRVKHAVEHVKT